MAEMKVQVGAVGLPIRLTITDQQTGEAVDLSLASTVTLILRKPDGERLEKTMTVGADGDEGKAVYYTEADDLDQGGLWKYQAVVAYASGASLPSEVGTLRVYENA